MSFIDHLLQPIMTRHYAIPLITCRTPDVPEDLGRSQRRQATSEAKGVGQVHQLSCNGINGFSIVSNWGVMRAIHLRLTQNNSIRAVSCFEGHPSGTLH